LHVLTVHRHESGAAVFRSLIEEATVPVRDQMFPTTTPMQNLINAHRATNNLGGCRPIQLMTKHQPMHSPPIE